MALRVRRRTYILAIAVTSAVVGLIEAVLPVLIMQPTVEGALAVFVPQIGTAVSAWLTAGEQTAPQVA